MDNEGLSPVKRAILELRELRSRLDEIEKARTEPIAIIGMGLRFPGNAHDAESYWHLLINGVDAITLVPSDRWDVDAFYDPDPAAPGKMYTREGGFLKDIDQFDPGVFGISPREAESMDPQQRLLLEVSWEALENAGQPIDRMLNSQTGVFVGISYSDYMKMLLEASDHPDAYLVTGNSLSIAAGRISYVLGLQGPSIAIDTACSSSLVAVHQAVISLRMGECDLALAGGVNLILEPDLNIQLCKGSFLSRDGRCKTFDARADGYVRGEGCAMIVLKRLSKALADGDRILAVVRGSAINQDGRSSGITAPNGLSQQAVIRRALENSGVGPRIVDYVEAHGTGTSLGDPIEVQALAEVYGQDRPKQQPLMIGSVKTNFGHLEAAAGIAGLIKAVLMLQYGEIPPHLHLEHPNPYIDWDQIPVSVATQRLPWPPKDGKRVVAVSSFGFSGTNAHMILEQAPERELPEELMSSALPERPYQILTLSARREEDIRKIAEQYLELLANDISFPDICFSASTRRAHWMYRLAVVAESSLQARSKIEQFLAIEAEQELPEGVLQGQADNAARKEVAFLFTGAGQQTVNMGRVLYETLPTFRDALQECVRLARPYLSDGSLLAALYPQDPAQAGLLAKMEYIQPVLFAVEYALGRVWQSWGIPMTVAMGHSLGEYVAACLAGVFSVADGLKLVTARGRLMDSIHASGEMVAIFTSEDRVMEELSRSKGQVAIAAINGPENIVISGETPAVQEILEHIGKMGVQYRKLGIPQASHSPLVEPVLDEFEQVAQEVRYHLPLEGSQLVSAMTGQLVVGGELSKAAYWREHFRQPVRFSAAIQTLHRLGYEIFLEIGPKPVLLGMGRRCLPPGVGVWLASLHTGKNDWQQMLESLAGLYVNGIPVDWQSFEKGYSRQIVSLPTYPWTRQRYWVKTGSRPSSAIAQPKRAKTISDWDCWIEAGSLQAEQGPLDLAVQTYPHKWDLLDQLTKAYILRTLKTFGLFQQKGERWTVDSILTHCKIQPVYFNLLQRWLKRLKAENWLQAEEASSPVVYINPEPLPVLDLESIWREVRSAVADLPILLDYLHRCGERLEAVLTGAESPLETLFPAGSYQFTDFLYRDWALVRYFNAILRAIVDSIVQTWSTDRFLRILEVGAGTGGTTAVLLPILPSNLTRYTFTDVSNLFLSNAAERFKAFPFVNYALLDIEQDPASQGFQPQSYDLIICANVLHATRDIKDTLRHVHSLLAPGGVLLLFEVTRHLSWFDITTGLIEGWERFDDHVREDVPLLSVQRWIDLLKEYGFSKVDCFPAIGSSTEVLGEHIVIARIEGEFSGEAEVVPAGTERAEPAGKEIDAVSSQSAVESIANRLAGALPEERHELLLEFVRHHIAAVLRITQGPKIGRKQRLMDLGMDSLMAVELRNRLSKDLNLERNLPATLIFDYPTAEAIADYLEGILVESEGVPPGSGSDFVDRESLKESLGDLTEDEVETLLLKKLKDLQ